LNSTFYSNPDLNFDYITGDEVMRFEVKMSFFVEGLE
jgi:hypothetical protein